MKGKYPELIEMRKHIPASVMDKVETRKYLPQAVPKSILPSEA